MCFRAINLRLVKLVFSVWYILLITRSGTRENELVDFNLCWRRKKVLSIFTYLYFKLVTTLVNTKKIMTKRRYISNQLLLEPSDLLLS